MSKEKLLKTSRKNGELLLKTNLKWQESLAPLRQNIKIWGVRDFCTVLQITVKDLTIQLVRLHKDPNTVDGHHHIYSHKKTLIRDFDQYHW